MKITESDYLYYEDSYQGYCPNCDSFTRDVTEPDAENYNCPECGENSVMGTMNALMMGYFEIV